MVVAVKTWPARVKALLVLAGMTVVGYVLALATHVSYVAGIADLLLLATFGASIVAVVMAFGRRERWSVPVAILGVVLAVMVATGALKAAWLAANLPSSRERGSGVPYVFLASLAPLSMAIAAVSLRKAPIRLGRKIVRIEVVGLAVGFLPWVLLMMTAIAD